MRNQHNWRTTFTGLFGFFLLTHAVASVSLAQEIPLDIGMDYRVPSETAAIGVLSTNSFVSWYRYPAEERNWLRMISDTAYFRDVVAGGQTFISGAVDGEVWNADATLPDGSTRIWPDLVFYKTYGNQQNCFVSPWWVICNTTSLYVLWYSNVQCQPTGTWTMSFYNNGGRFYTGNYTLLPQIFPGKVSLYNQGAYLDAYDSICKGPLDSKGKPTVVPCSDKYPSPWTIKAKGCYLTDAAMVLSYHGVGVDPPTLNTWLIANNGYNLTGDVDPYAVARYARSRGVNMSYNPPEPDSQRVWTGLERLERFICYYGPHLMGVKLDSKGRPQHWVTATGRDSNRTTYQVNDPAGGVATTHTGTDKIRLFGGPQYIYTDMTGIRITFHSPGELLLVDSQGRKVGYDPIRGIAYNEIPGAFYEQHSLADDETGDPGPETTELDVPRPLAGEYQLQVVGTDSGTYSLEIAGYDPELNPSKTIYKDIPTSSGTVHSFGFFFAKTVGAEIEVSGGFDGGGQRPKDVNKFLSYISPSESQTTLSAGTTSFDLWIAYGKAIIPTTFAATLNGVNVAYLYTPTPGTNQVVNLPLQPGRNVLVLSVEGNLPNRVATDTDRLVFIVP